MSEIEMSSKIQRVKDFTKENVTNLIVVIFSLGLSIYFYYQYKNYLDNKASLTWPKEYPDCPDYWVSKNNKCINIKNLGKKRYSDTESDFGKVMNFNRQPFIGNEGLINKCKWAKKHNISWEGIDNLAHC